MFQRISDGFRSISTRIKQPASPLQPDPGYDSKNELMLALALFEFNELTGPLAGQVMARFERTADGEISHLFAWIAPHFHDPVAIIITPEGKCSWQWADNPEMVTEAWRSDIHKNDLATEMVSLMQRKLPESFFLPGAALPSAFRYYKPEAKKKTAGD